MTENGKKRNLRVVWSICYSISYINYCSYVPGYRAFETAPVATRVAQGCTVLQKAFAELLIYLLLLLSLEHTATIYSLPRKRSIYQLRRAVQSAEAVYFRGASYVHVSIVSGY